MTGIVLTFLGVVFAAYFIMKRYYAPWILLVTGVLLITITGLGSNTALITGKSATNNFIFDVVQIVTDLFKSRAAGLGLNIMIVGGFAYYMDSIGATGALVKICTKPLSKIHSPYLLLAFAYILGQLLNIFIPSATGLGMLLMVTFFPLLVSMGVSRYSAAAIIATCSALDLGPASGNSILASELSKVHVMEYFFQGQIPIALLVIPVCAIAHAYIQKWFDKKDLEKGILTKADFELTTTSHINEKSGVLEHKVPLWFGLIPLLPVVLLFTFSKFMIQGVKLELVTALLFCIAVGFLADLLIKKSFKQAAASTKSVFTGMGKVFGSTVVLIVCAEVFANGLKRTGGINTILDYVASLNDIGAIIMLIIMLSIMALAAFVTGSGNAAFFAFSNFLPNCAKSVGWETIAFASPVQLASGIARSMSPISGVTMAVAGLADVSPFALVRRTFPVMLIALFTTTISTFLI